MRTDRELEALLRRSFQDEARKLSRSPGADNSTAGTRTETHTRPWAPALVAAAAVAALIGGGAAFNGMNPPDSSPEPTASTSDVWTWAKSLPRGSGPELYLEGTRLHWADRTLRLEATDAELVGMSASGPVLLAEAGDGAAIPSRYIVVGPDGDVRELPQQQYQVQNAALAPEGDALAYGDAVVQIANGETVAPLPDRATALGTWTAEGLAYYTAEGDAFVWQPGTVGQGQPIGSRLGAASGEFTLTKADGCSLAVRILRSGETQEVARNCSAELLTVSPSAQYALGEPLALGAPDDLRAPRGLSAGAALAGDIDYTWESNSTVVFSVQRFSGDQDAATGPRSIVALLVRCQADTGECERASEPLTTPPHGQVQLP